TMHREMHPAATRCKRSREMGGKICSRGGFRLHSVSRMEEENELIALRRRKVETLRTRDVAPFGQSFDTSGSIAEVREKFTEGAMLRAAGRITAHRDMGKSHFLDLRDATGRIQIYVQAKELGPEAMEIFGLL